MKKVFIALLVMGAITACSCPDTSQITNDTTNDSATVVEISMDTVNVDIDGTLVSSAG